MNKFIRVYLLMQLGCYTILAQSNSEFQSKFTVRQLQEAPASLIPFPQKVSWKGESLELRQLNLEFGQGIKKYSDFLKSEAKRIFDGYNIRVSKNASISVKFEEDLKILPEGYQLKVAEEGITIAASTESGTYYALQTIGQLINTELDKPLIPLCEITDWPEHSVRGYMIDVGRNYQSMASLQKQLDIMARYKMNTFHWHLTDRPAWRIESKKYPQLTYSSNHRQTRNPGKYYSYDEIRELIKYAKDRYISVIPEIDMPGHSDSFRTAMGVKMESKEGMVILENILKEFFDEIPIEDCPIIHIGSDEVRIPNPDEFISKMVNVCQSNGRQVVVWNPGLVANDAVIRQTWQAKHVEKANFKEIDSWDNYINGAEPMMQVLRLFFRPLGFPSENEVIGGVVCLWPDVNLVHETDAFEQNPVYPSMLTYAWKSWTADLAKGLPEYYVKMPLKSTQAYRYFSVFESILMDHKQKYFSDEPFPYYAQNDKEWNIIGLFDGNDGDKLLEEMKDSYAYKNNVFTWIKAAGNTLVLKERWVKNGYFPEADSGKTAYVMTYIHSDIEKEIDVMIGFETALRANKVYTGVPQLGSWDPSGGNIWVNDKPVPPPVWKNPGWKPSKSKGWGSKEDQEIPWEKQDFYWTREAAKIHLKKGWNKVFAKVPCSSSYQNWMFTFIPLQMEGLVFSSERVEKL